jgi:DNA-binding transcriptional ArsR family regulator
VVTSALWGEFREELERAVLPVSSSATGPGGGVRSRPGVATFIRCPTPRAGGGIATIESLFKREEHLRMLDQLRRDITTRLEELVGEADKLRRALTALGNRNSTSASASRPATHTPRANASSARTAEKRSSARTTTPARSRASRSAKTKSATRASGHAAPGATKTAVIAALAGGQAMTAGEIATATGLGAATVSTTLSRLAKAGEITKANRGYQAKNAVSAPSDSAAATARRA